MVTVKDPKTGVCDLQFDQSGSLPFTPFSAPLGDVLRHKFIKPVTLWLLGQDDNSILAQAGNSVWESALTLLFLAEVDNILGEAQEDPELQDSIRCKVPIVTRWLLSKKSTSSDGNYICWEHVTWDTSVVVRALIILSRKYWEEFSDDEQCEIQEVIEKAVRWLSHSFEKWENQVKYPYGPADIAQILITVLELAKEYPDLYDTFCRGCFNGKEDEDLATEIVQYLLHKKTEKTLTVTTTEGAESVVSYWWDNYVGTAEVIEALARFCQYFDNNSRQQEINSDLLLLAKRAIVRACLYFEQCQIDGMWGSSIDTIRVITAYVLIRRYIPRRMGDIDDPLITPEIHTTFKALRWLCDEKQIFSDGSFLHSLFLTIFYALALVEIYRSWEACNLTVEEVYDDVVWYSPVRTTPERSKRLAAELAITNLQSNLTKEEKQKIIYKKQMEYERRHQLRFILTAVMLVVTLSSITFLGDLLGFYSISVSAVKQNELLAFLAVVIPIVITLLALIWKYDRFVGGGS